MKKNYINLKYVLLSICSFSGPLMAAKLTPGHWYMGAGLGGVNTHLTDKGTHSFPSAGNTSVGTDFKRLSKSYLTAQVQGGYTKAYHNMFLIGELLMRPLEESTASGSTVWGMGRDPAVQIRTSIVRQYTLGFNAKAGLTCCEQWGVFGSLGVLYSKFNIKRGYYSNGIAPNAAAASSQSDRAWGFAPGVGILYNLTENIPLKLEYIYEVYGSVKGPQFTANTNTLVANGTLYGNGKINPQYHTLILSLSYKF